MTSHHQPRSVPGPASAALPGGAFLCLVVYCSMAAVLITVGSARLIPNQDENTYPESTNIYAAINAVRTGDLYSSPSEPPYVLQPFGPLYYVINAAIARASDLDFDGVRGRARLLAYGCYLLSAAVVFLICRRLRFSVVSSVLAGLMLLGQPSFLYWSATARPDLPFLLVMLLSLLWAVAGDTFRGGGYVLAGTLAGLAFLIKQPAIAAPIAVVTVLFLRRESRSATVYALSAAVPVALAFGVLQWHHGPFVEQFVSVGKGLWSFTEGARFAQNKLVDVTMMVPIAIGGIGFARAIRGDTPSRIVAAFALANWVVGMSGLPQLGSDTNYFLPGLAGCALLLPFAIQAVRSAVRRRAVFVVIGCGLLWTALQEQRRFGWMLSADFRLPTRPYAALAPFKILSDRTMITMHGRDPDLLDPYTAHELELAGRWNSSPIVEHVRRGDYDLVIFGGSRDWQVINTFRGVAYFGPAVVDALNEAYTILCATTSTAVLVPRARDVDANPAMLASILGQPCDPGTRGVAPRLTLPPGAR